MTTTADPPPEPRSGKDAASAAMDEADAAKAAAAAEQARAEADKARADAAKAWAEARKAAAETADYESASGQMERDAEARKAASEADRDAAKARREQLAALIPDLSHVEAGTLEVKDGPPLWATVLTYHALRDAAKAIAGGIKTARGEVQGSWRVLVTGGADLAAADAVYQDVSTGLEQLIAAADKLSEEFAKETAESVTDLGTGPFDVIAAVAGAVPAVLSLLSTNRVVSTAAVTVQDLAAAAEVAGAMIAADVRVVHDDFRLVPAGRVLTLMHNLSERRQTLVGHKIKLADQKAALEEQRTVAAANLAELVKQRAAAGNNPPADLVAKLATAEAEVAGFAKKLTMVAVRLGMVDSVIGAIDSYVAAIRVVPAGGRRSALATAALHDQLHPAQDSTDAFTHVLLVKAQGGQAQQLTTTRALRWRDSFSTVVDVNVTYMLIEVARSEIVAAQTVTRTAAVRGKIGGHFEVKVTAGEQ